MVIGVDYGEVLDVEGQRERERMAPQVQPSDSRCATLKEGRAHKNRVILAKADLDRLRRLLGYLVEKVALGDGGVTLYLRSETLEVPKVNHPERKFSQGGEWLPLADLNCGPSD